MTEPAAPPLVEIRGLTVRAHHDTLLEQVDLSVAPGTVHALLGRNGAGKSTLLRALLGEVEFTGSIELHWRGSGRIGLVPQRLTVDGTLALTAGEFLALTRQRAPVGFRRGAATRQRVHGLLRAAALEDCEGKPLAGLSGGELRRLLLAHALDPLPELLLLDEPTEGLDGAAREWFMAQVAAARRQGTTILLVSHDLPALRECADRATWLDRQVRANGPAAEVVGAYRAAGSAP